MPEKRVWRSGGGGVSRGSVTVIMLVMVGELVELGWGCKRNATENFPKARRSNRRKAFARGKAGCGQIIPDHDQLIWIRALVAVSADGRGDRPDRRGTIAIDPTHEVPEAVVGGRPGKTGFRILAGRIILHRVWHATVQPSLQHVGEFPRTDAGVEHPLLQSRPGLRGGRRRLARCRIKGVGALAFIADIQRLPI